MSGEQKQEAKSESDFCVVEEAVDALEEEVLVALVVVLFLADVDAGVDTDTVEDVDVVVLDTDTVEDEDDVMLDTGYCIW
jgi:hypothetical protein